MAEEKFYNPYVEVNGVDLSAHARAIKFDQSTEAADVSRFGDEHKRKKAGLHDTSISVTFIQDHASGAVDQTLSPLKEADTEFSLIWKPANTTASATNPQYSGTVWISSYPLGGSHGEFRMPEVTFETVTDITRTTGS